MAQESESEKKAKLILDHAIVYLKGTHLNADALDNKASRFINVFTAIATASFAFGFNLWKESDFWIFAIPFFILSFGLCLSSFFFSKVMKPRLMYTPGNSPKNVNRRLNYLNLIKNEAKSYEKEIKSNDKVNKKKAKLLQLGLNTMLGTILAFLLISLGMLLAKSSCFQG